MSITYVVLINTNKHINVHSKTQPCAQVYTSFTDLQPIIKFTILFTL